FEFGQLAAPRHLHLELAAAAAHDRTVGIRRVQRVDEPPPPGAPAAAGSDIAAGPAEGGHGAGVGKRLAIDDVGSAIEQEIEWRAPQRSRRWGGAPAPGKSPRGWPAARGVPRTAATPQPPRRGGNPAIARTSGSPIAITSVLENNASKPRQYSS